jgi:5-methylcytosine-specific restriction protein A
MGYGAAWRAGLREKTLREEPWCRMCLAEGKFTPSRHADHIVPKEDGGLDVRENLQGLCHPHHSRKTINEQRARGLVR